MERSAGFLVAIALTAVTYVACTGDGPTTPDATALAPTLVVGGFHCPGFNPGNSRKDDNGAPWTITVPAGKVVVAVCVKAGTRTFTKTSNGYFGPGGTCYRARGIGTRTVTVTGGGTSSTCKSISHIEARSGPGPTPTPSPSPSSAPS